MARIVKEYNERRTELLDTAQDLFYQKGYENTSVADIIHAVGIAKGTFYHYFKSKEDLLDQIVARQTEMIDQVADPIVSNTEMNAIEKFNALYASISQYKLANRDVMIMLIKVLYAHENVVLLDRMMKSREEKFGPVIAKVICQGIAEGVFNAGPAEHVAEMILQMGTQLGEDFARIIEEDEFSPEERERVIQKCMAYENAVARILGAEEGSIRMFNREVIDRFFDV